MKHADQLHQMDAYALRLLASQLISRVAEVERDNQLKQLKIDQLSHEMAILRRFRFGKRSETTARRTRAALRRSGGCGS